MLEQLMQFIQQNGGQEAVVNNTAVPNEQNSAVMQEAGSSIMSAIQGMLGNGQENQVAQMMQDPNHPAVQQAQNHFAGNIMEKFGISGNAAKSIAISLIPTVLGALAGRGNNGGNTGTGFNLSSLVQSLAGGASTQQGGGNAISAIGGALGLDKDGDGDVDLGDVTKMIGL